MSAGGAFGGAVLFAEPEAAPQAALRAKIAERLHRRLDLAGARPEQPVRVLVVAEADGGDALAAFARAQGWKVDRRAPDVLSLRLPAEAFDEVLVARADMWVAADVATKLSGLRLASEKTVAHVAIAAPEDRWPGLRGLGLQSIGEDDGLVTGNLTGGAFARLAATHWIEAIEVRAVEPAIEELVTEDEELDPGVDPIPDDADDDPADAIGPPILPE